MFFHHCQDGKFKVNYLTAFTWLLKESFQLPSWHKWRINVLSFKIAKLRSKSKLQKWCKNLHWLPPHLKSVLYNKKQRANYMKKERTNSLFNDTCFIKTSYDAWFLKIKQISLNVLNGVPYVSFKVCCSHFQMMIWMDVTHKI